MKNKSNKEAEDRMFELFNKRNFSAVESFIEKYGCEFIDRDGRNLLMNLIIEGKNKFAIELIKRYSGKELNVNWQDNYGWTALHFAVQEKSLDVLNALIEVKANMNLQDEYGRTPLFIAIFENSDKLSIALLENGADIHLSNKSGASPEDFLSNKLKKWINENLITDSKPTE